ncbi:MAG: hypothetical protein PSX81_03330 [bacterium]|nr:hypothetical protein [bacterium]
MDVIKGHEFCFRTKKPPYHPSDILKFTHIYIFHNKNNWKYVVNVEEYKHDVFIMKFFKQNHADSKFRYSILTNEYDARKIIQTCVNIGLHVLQQFPKASFGFLGMPTMKELKREDKIFNTKRYRVYEKYATFFFKEENFEHNFDINTSAYFMLNKKQLEDNKHIKKTILQMFTNHFIISDFFRELLDIEVN